MHYTLKMSNQLKVHISKLLGSKIFQFFILPHLLSGSADRTVKFWDLETFELIGSAGPEVLYVPLNTALDS